MGSVFAASPDPGFEAHVRTLDIGPIKLFFGWYGGQSIVRGPDQLRDEPMDIVTIALAGTMAFDGPLYRIAPGELAVLDFAQPFEHHSTAGSLISIVIPRALAIAHGLDPLAQHGLVVGKRNAVMLRTLLASVEGSAHGLSSDQAELLAAAILNLVAAAIRHGKPFVGLRGPEIVSARKARAEQVIAMSGEDERLTVAGLARTLKISRSALYALYRDEGGVERRIRRERLAAAKALLAGSDVRIGEIALRLGFHDAAHFARAFRQAFGETPSAWRSAAARPGR